MEDHDEDDHKEDGQDDEAEHEEHEGDPAEKPEVGEVEDEEMEAELAEARSTEKDAAANFEEMDKAKSAEIEEGETKAERKEDELSASSTILAEAKEDLSSTRDALASDVAFISDLRLRCQQSDKDWELRSKTRSDEIAAVSEVISMLSDDDAFDLFGKTVDSGSLPSFTQIREEKHVRARLVSELQKVARKTGTFKLSEDAGPRLTPA